MIATRYASIPGGVRALLALVVVGALPLLALGPGTDLDVGAVIQTGEGILDGTYRPSRPPGTPVHETLVGVLHAIGGAIATNLLSLVSMIGLLTIVVFLARREGVGSSWLVALAVVTNPWFFVAGTSTVEAMLAIALAIGGAYALRTRRDLVAAVLFGLSIGARFTTALVVAAALLAELPERRDRRVVTVGLLTIAIGVACFVPAMVSSGSSRAFAQNEFETTGVAALIGRAGAKNLYFFGPFAVIVLLVLVPRVWHALQGWRASWIVRFAVLTIVFEEALFLRFPWKMSHLLPVLVALALLLGVALKQRPQLLIAFAVAQLLYAAVNVQLLEPDNPNRASSAQFVFDVRWGALVTDIACRADDTSAWKNNDKARLEAVWNCAKPFGDGP